MHTDRSAHQLENKIQFIKGVGPARFKLLERLGISTVRGLLSYFPDDYSDRTDIRKIFTLQGGEKASIFAKVEAAEEIRLNMNLRVFKVAVTDGSGVCYISFFRHVNPYHKHDLFGALKKTFTRGVHAYFYGPVEDAFGKKEIKAEDYEIFDPSAQAANSPLSFGKILPVYSLTEGLQQKWLRTLIHKCLEEYSSSWPELMNDDELRSKGLIKAGKALRELHFPSNINMIETARQRLAFDEFLLLECALTLAKSRNNLKQKIYKYQLKKNLLTPFKQHLGFEFTNAQKKSINEIFTDLTGTKPMNRLLLGDVGSGKTVVALSAMLLACENKYQSAFLAPTEILAQQHFVTINRHLSGLGVKTCLITGRTKGTEKKKLIEQAAKGEFDIIVGTHALLEDNVKFKNLSLAVIDEQQRFGVMQRANLIAKSGSPDVLVMTATPIPRTLALTVYGDLDISAIDSLPPGRLPVETFHLHETAAYEMAKQEIQKGNQCFIVYPLVQESDKLELKAAVHEADVLSKTVFANNKTGILHGRMKAAEKDKVMQDFRDKKFDILFSTTVIEVGIDIPDAAIMLIEHSERFGLATLHQLRGRIGRSNKKSVCVLLGNPSTEFARKRIEVMLSTSDGFKIAEEDLKLRGAGEFFGTAQHGIPELKAGNIAKDIAIIQKTREYAEIILNNDETLSADSHKTLRCELLRIYSGKFGLLKIG